MPVPNIWYVCPLYLIYLSLISDTSVPNIWHVRPKNLICLSLISDMSVSISDMSVPNYFTKKVRQYINNDNKNMCNKHFFKDRVEKIFFYLFLNTNIKLILVWWCSYFATNLTKGILFMKDKKAITLFSFKAYWKILKTKIFLTFFLHVCMNAWMRE